MIYAFIIIILLLVIMLFTAVFSTDKLTKLLLVMSLLTEKFAELMTDTKQIHETITNINENNNKKPIKKFNIDYSSNSYMREMYGYIEQTKMYTPSVIIQQMEKMPFTDIVEYIKQHYFMMFISMMHKNNLKFDDFKIHSTLGGMEPQTCYFIKFELKDMEDSWPKSKRIVLIEMKNGDQKEFEVQCDINHLEEYLETEYEGQRIDFFDALSQVYSSFSFDEDNYYFIYHDDSEKYIIVINDLSDLYQYVNIKMNVLLPSEEKHKDLFISSEILDKSWAIDKLQRVQILDWQTMENQREELFNFLLHSKDENEKFILATMHYYKPSYYYQLENSFDEQKLAINIWKDLAKKGHAYSQLIMGILYFDGLHVLKNFSKSKYYIQLAFDSGLEVPARKVWEDLKLYEYN